VVRPSDVAIAPDGALFVSDWYDPGVGGHNMGDHKKGELMGRIYRVAQNPAQPQPLRLDFSTPAGAAAALQSPNKAAQHLAWQSLHRMGAQAEADLLKLWKNENPRLRARALGLLSQIKGRETQHLAAGLRDADSDVRVFSVRLARMLATSREFDTSALEEDRELMGTLMRDASPQVRRQIALSLTGTKEIARLWSALALQHDGRDRWYLEALGIGARGNEEACFTEWLGAVGDKWNSPAGRDIIWRMRTSRTAGYLAKILQDQAIAAAEKPRYLRAFDFLPEGSEKTTALVQLAALGKADESVAIEALQRLKDVDLSRHPEAQTALQNLLASTRGTARYVDLVRDFKITGQSAGFAGIYRARSGESGGDRGDENAARKRSERAHHRAQRGRKPRGHRGARQYRGSAHSRAAAADPRRCHQRSGASPAGGRALAQSQAGIGAMIDLAKNGQFPAELQFAAASALAAVQNARFRGEIAQHFALPNAAGGQAMPPTGELVKRKGDLAKGKLVYEKVESTCVTCHRIGDVARMWAQRSPRSARNSPRRCFMKRSWRRTQASPWASKRRSSR
jgi:hypothetical protein